jgi:hypothetical protein
LSRPIDRTLIVSIVPYFLERKNFLFEKNLKEVTGRACQAIEIALKEGIGGAMSEFNK